MRPLILIFAMLILSSRSAHTTDPADALMAYKGTWVIFKTKDGIETRDTLCKTTATWLPKQKRLVAGQVISGDNGITKDSCFYAYDVIKKIYTYYETDETSKVTATSDIIIDGKTWIYDHHINSVKKYRTLNIFNEAGDVITYRSQRSDDEGKTWITTRTGNEYRSK